MRIDFYISSLSSGGAENVLANLSSNFALQGHDVSIASYEKRPQFYEIDNSVKVFKFDNNSNNKIKELIKDFCDTRKQLRDRKAEVSISFLSRCNIMLVFAGLFSKTKIIVCDRNNILRKYSKKVFYVHCLAYLFADAVIVQTNEMRKKYPRFLQKKISILENPLDFEALEKQCNGQNMDKTDTFISIGRLEKQKDFKTLVRAFSKIQSNFPTWKLKIFGQGNLREEIQSYIEKLHMEHSIELCGVTHKPFLEMKRSEIFVLSSFYEGFPNVLCEAMHAGLPCVSTRCECGPGDLIDSGKTGILVPVGDANEMARSMKYLIENQDIRLKMGREAASSVEYLELGKVCSRWLDMINGVVV